MKPLCATIFIVASLSFHTGRTNAQTPQSEVLIKGSVIGTVTDRSGAAVAGVTVTLSSRNFRQQRTTNEAGRYVFHQVPVGSSYRLVFRMAGFTTETRNVQVTAGGSSQIHVQLERSLSTPSPSPSSTATATPTPTLTPPPASPTPSTAPSPAGSPTSSPEPTVSPSPGTITDPMIEAEVSKLLDRAIAFNPPSEMRQGTAGIISARITLQPIPDTTLTTGMPGPGTPQVQRIKVGSVMKVVLMGDQNAFNIHNLNSEEQVVEGRQFSQWEWNVTPLVSGEQNLRLRVSATISTPHRGEKIVDIPVLHRTIKVRVDPWYASRKFIGENWQWLWTTLVIPIGLGIWRLRKSKKA